MYLEHMHVSRTSMGACSRGGALRFACLSSYVAGGAVLRARYLPTCGQIVFCCYGPGGLGSY